MSSPRISKDKYYLSIAEQVSKRSTCIRRQYGAVIVKNDEIISTGYNGAPRGINNCIDCGFCLRNKLHIEQGQRYELCKAIHAEQNAIISAKRSDIIGSTLYLAGFEASNDMKKNYLCEYSKSIEAIPCLMCKRFIINAGIVRVVSNSLEGIKSTDVLEYIKELNDYDNRNN